MKSIMKLLLALALLGSRAFGQDILINTQSMTIAPSDSGFLSGNGIILVSLATASGSFMVPVTGLYDVSVPAAGQWAANVAPILELRLDGVVIGNWPVPTTTTYFRVDGLVMNVGMHVVAVTFLNDYYDPAVGEDRNLVLGETITIIPEAPPPVPPIPAVAGKFKIEWDPNSEPALAGYRVYRSEQRGAYPAVPLYTTQAIQYQDATAQPGHTYFYVVTAFQTDAVESAYSNEVGVAVTEAQIDILKPSL